MTTKVKIVVYEDNNEVSTFGIIYYEGQPYTVVLETPDGRDGTTGQMIAGES